RVRTEIGRACSHPHAIQAASEGGRVTLCGPILGVEADEVLRRVARVRGVRGVEDRLERHDTAEHVSSLPGQAPPRAPPATGWRWPRARRLLGGAAGAALMLVGLRRSRRMPLFGRMLAAGGAALLGRAAWNAPARGLFGLGPAPAIELQKTLYVEAPADEVFA